MKDMVKAVAILLFISAILIWSIGLQVWRIKQFQKATGFGFIKAAFVLM